uniref:Helicase n=1 Tax=viral metagenome TaxID=1070528 RepID=A0A6C0JEU6_9ZZZZ
MLEKELETSVKGGLLCDDPGLGKTIQTIGLMLGNKVNCTLIAVPTSVINQWYNVMCEIFTKEKVYLHYGTERINNSMKLLYKIHESPIVITSHSSLFNILDKENQHTCLHDVHWGRVVIDEGHTIRNQKTLLHRMACDLNAKHKWILTGTPVQNKEKDIKSLFKFIGISAREVKTNLEKCISTYLLRRTKDILFDETFKNYTVVNHSCEFTTQREQEIYSKIQEGSIQKFLKKEEEMVSNPYIQLLELLLRLRQASIHPSIALASLKKKFPDEKWDDESFSFNKGSTKMLSALNKIKETKGLSIVFCQFVDEMEYMKELLLENNIYSETYKGGMTITERQTILDKFKKENLIKKFVISKKTGKPIKVNNKKPTVLLIQIKAGGVGLNLQQFSNILILSPDWNPSNEIQGIARAHRIGQKDEVKVHKFTLIANPKYEVKDSLDKSKQLMTIDQRILNIQVQKRDIMSSILNDDSLIFNEKFTGKELNNKLSYNDLRRMIIGS